MTAPLQLYHYTCRHSAADIHRLRRVLPHRHALLPSLPALVWLSDLAAANRDQLGLSAHWLWCNRTTVRVDVQPHDGVMPWHHWADTRDVPDYTRALIDSDGARPDTWWVAETSVAVVTVHLRRDTPTCLIRS